MGNWDSLICPLFRTAVTYDGENHAVQVADTTPGGQAPVTFTYDANGQRVTKASGSGTVIYAADAFGQVVAEYSTAATAQVACATCFFTADHLGSTRLVTDANANVVSRRDYLPFGEQIDPWIGPRNQQWNDNDNASHKFTGQERDQETGMDFFQARYYSAAIGRFTSADPRAGGSGSNESAELEWVWVRIEQSVESSRSRWAQLCRSNKW